MRPAVGIKRDCGTVPAATFHIHHGLSIIILYANITNIYYLLDGGDTFDLIRSGITLFDHEHQSSLANVYNPKIYPAYDKPEANTQIEPLTGPSTSARWNDEASPPDYETGYLNQLPPQPQRSAPSNEFPLKEHCALFPLSLRVSRA